MARVTSPVLVGRARELDSLRASWETARAGSPSVVLISGEAGVGKTRLLGEFLATVAESALCAVGHCVDLADSALPLAPVAELFGIVAGHLTADERAAVEDLAGLVPEFGPPRPSTASHPPSRLYESGFTLVGRVARRRPVVLVVEDLHWSDPSTRDFLSYVVRRATNEPLLLIGTLRSDELHRRHPLRAWLAEVERHPSTERLVVGRLERHDVAAQIGGILGEQPSSVLVDSVFARSDGNPFFAEELIAAARVGVAGVSETVRDVVLARVELLPPSARRLLRVAAAGGDLVDHDVLCEVAELGDDETTAIASDLVADQLLVPEGDGYRFRHALGREAVEDELLPRERRRLHGQYAAALARRAPSDAIGLAQLAHHWRASGDATRSLAASVAAGVAAEAVPAPAEALFQLERALELWDLVPDAPAVAGMSLIDLLVRAGIAAEGAGHASRAAALLQQAVDEEPDAVARALILERLATVLWLSNHCEAARVAIAAATDAVPPDPPTPALARVLATDARIHQLECEYAKAVEVARHALDVARAVGADDDAASALVTIGSSANATSRESGLRDLLDGIDLARRAGAHAVVARGVTNLTVMMWLSARLTEAIDAAREGLDDIRRAGMEGSWGGKLETLFLELLYLTGGWDEACERATTFRSRMPADAWASEDSLPPVFAVRGAFDEARALLRPPPTVFGLPRESAVIFNGRAAATLALWERRFDDARRVLLETLATADAVGSPAIGELVWLGVATEAELASRPEADGEARRRCEDLAVDYRTRLARLLTEGVPTGEAPSVQAPTWLALADAELTRLRGEPDPDSWSAPVDTFDEFGYVYYAAYARFRRAEALIASGGDRILAASLLDAAVAAAEELGAEPLRAEIELLSRRAGLTRAAPETASSSGGPLTERERQVLALVAAGRSNRQIGEELFISTKTASVHVSNILAKLQVRTRGEAAAVAHRIGLFEHASSTASKS